MSQAINPFLAQSTQASAQSSDTGHEAPLNEKDANPFMSMNTKPSDDSKTIDVTTSETNQATQSAQETAPAPTNTTVNPFQQVAGQANNANPFETAEEVAMQGTGEYTEISMDDEVKIVRFESLRKMKKGEKIRVCFVLFDKKDAPILKMTHQLRVAAAQRSFILPKDPVIQKKCIDVFGDPSPRFGTVIMLYKTDQIGNITGYELVSWVFGPDKYPQLKNIHKEWKLKERDLIVECVEENFQKWLIQPAAKCFFSMLNEDQKAAITAEAKDLYEKYMVRRMGYSLTETDIVKVLQGDYTPLGVVTGATSTAAGSVYNPTLAAAALAGQVGSGTAIANNATGIEFKNLVR